MHLEQELKEIIDTIVGSPLLHAKWLNSLSLMENTGSRKISRYQHPIKTNIILLKHAAEEARHAYYLKKQIEKLVPDNFPDYTFEFLLAPVKSYHYLHRLDVTACRYLRADRGYEGRDVEHGAYLLVTYAIEVRADSLYGLYQDSLTELGSRVNVKSIILEEEGHLAEMIKMLQAYHPDWEIMADNICKLEHALFHDWMNAVKREINIIPSLV